MLTLVMVALLLQGAQTPEPTGSGGESKDRTWTGCLQAGTAPSTYRLNLDDPEALQAAGTSGAEAATTGPEKKESVGGPFVQLVTRRADLDLTTHVGRRVRVTGRELTAEEAETESAKRPNRQEAAETAAGTGGATPRRDVRYVLVAQLVSVGACEEAAGSPRP